MPKRIPVPCPQCSRELKVRREYLGHELICTHCSHAFRPPDRLVIPCPSCGEEGAASAERLGQWVRCGSCDRPFEADVGHGFRFEAVASTPDLALLDVGSLIAEVEEARETLDLVSSERDTASGQAARAELLQDELTSLRAEFDALKAEAESHRDSSADLDRHREELRVARMDVDRLRQALSSAEAAACQIDPIRAERDRLAAELQEALAAAEAASGRMDALRDERDRLASELEVARASAENAVAEAHRLRADDRAGIEAEWSGRLERERAALRDEREALGAQHAGREAERDELRAERDRLSKELRAAKEEAARAIDEANRRRDAERATLAEAAEVAEVAKAEARAELDAERAAAAARDEATRRDWEGRLEDLARTLREERETVAAELGARLDAERAEAREHLDRAVAGRASVEDEAARLREERDQLRAAFDSERAAAEGRHAQSVRELTQERDALRDRLTADLEQARTSLAHVSEEREAAVRERDIARNPGQSGLQQEVASLKAEYNALVDRWNGQVDHLQAALQAKADLERRLSEALADLNAATYHAETLEADIRHAHDRLEFFGMDEVRQDRAPSRGTTIAAGSAQAEDLSEELAKSRVEVMRLREMFRSLGIGLD